MQSYNAISELLEFLSWEWHTQHLYNAFKKSVYNPEMVMSMSALLDELGNFESSRVIIVGYVWCTCEVWGT